MAIENFQPETPTEMMLWNEIKRLHREAEMAGLLDYVRMTPSNKPVEIETVTMPPVLSLYPIAELLANIDRRGRLCVKLTGRPDGDSFGSAYYVDATPRPRHVVADMLIDLHKRELGKIARLLEGQPA